MYRYLLRAAKVLQIYQSLIKITSNTIYIAEFSGGLICPRKIHFNTQWSSNVVDIICPPWLRYA